MKATISPKFGPSFLLIFLLTNQIEISGAVVRNVLTAEQFQHALDKAMPGDFIKLRSDEIFFQGQEFIATRSGEAGYPITITGSASPSGSASIILDANSSNSSGTTGLTILGDHWVLEGIEVIISEPNTGVWIEGNNNSLSSLLVTAYETGVYIDGSGNTLANSIIKSSNGTGIHLLGNYNNVTGNVVEGSEWGLYLSNGTCCAEIVSNTVKGPVVVQGTDHWFKEDVINGELLVLECNNQFLDVLVTSKNPSNFPENCPPIDNQGILFTHKYVLHGKI